MVVQNIEQTNFLRVLLGCGCRVSSDVLLPQSASGVCMQMVVQNIEQTNFLRVLLGCGCRVSS